MPLIFAVPSPLSLRVSPAGRVPAVCFRLAAGAPSVPIVKLPATPVVKLALVAVLKLGATPGLKTLRTKLCVALPSLLVADRLSG